jgi:hypothetical protein
MLQLQIAMLVYKGRRGGRHDESSHERGNTW